MHQAWNTWAGECFNKLILPALNATLKYSISWIVDPKPIEQILTDSSTARFNDNFEHHQKDGFLDKLPIRDVDAVIDATPNRYHQHNIILVLSAGKHLYVEKPFTINHSGISEVDKVIATHSRKLAYFPLIFRDENGLPVRILTEEIKSGDWYEQFFGSKIDHRLYGVLKSIGDIKCIIGTFLEGEGKKAQISHRLWLGDSDQGGILLDTGSHLLTFLPLLRNKIGDVAIEDSRSGISKDVKNEYKQKTGKSVAETYAELSLRSDKGAMIKLAFGKYTGFDKRVIQIEGEHGFISIDFDSKTTVIDSPIFQGKVTVNHKLKYGIIVPDFIRRLKNPSLHHEYGFSNSRETLKLILTAREFSANSKSFLYDTGDIPSANAIIGMLRNL